MQWMFLCMAILFEVAGTVSMKLSSGFTRLLPSVLLMFLWRESFLSDAYAQIYRCICCLRSLVGDGHCPDHNCWVFVFSREYKCHETDFNRADYCRCCVFKPDRSRGGASNGT